MYQGNISVDVMGDDPREVLSSIRKLEERGIQAVWLPTEVVGIDGLTLLSAAAVQTERIMLGTSIIPTWPRHPVTAVTQAMVVAELASGRFRLGIGPGHKSDIADKLGFDFKTPLTNLREYLHVAKALLREGRVDFEGEHYKVHASVRMTYPDVPIMASALRRASFHLCGAQTDGAISWLCPTPYLRDVAIPAMKEGAQEAGRPIPPLIAHAPVCVYEGLEEVRACARNVLADYPRYSFYANMFAKAGYPEAEETGGWSDRMLDAVVFSGDEDTVRSRIEGMFDLGASEVVVTVLPVSSNPDAVWERTVSVLADKSGDR